MYFDFYSSEMNPDEKLNTTGSAGSGVTFHFDYQDGEYGYNTSNERGADTFHPFSSGGGSIADYYSVVDQTLVDITYSSGNLAYTKCEVGKVSGQEINTGTTTNSASVDVPIITTQSGATLQLVEAKVTLVAYAYAGASESNPTLANSSSSTTVNFKNSDGVVSFTDSVSAYSSQYSTSNPSKVAVCNCLSRPNLRGTTKITVYITTSASNRKYKYNTCTSNAYASNVIGSYLVI